MPVYPIPSVALHGDIGAAESFIAGLPHTVVTLVAIDPDTGHVDGLSRAKGDPALLRFVEERNGRKNLYFGINEARPDFTGAKPKKSDIAVIHGVGVDLDPSETRGRAELLKAARDALDDDFNAPDVAIDSGNGVQCLWWTDPLEATPANTADAEAQGRGLAHRFTGDAVQNVDRVFRLPGTVNLPTATKRAKGRTAAPASVIGTGDRLLGRGLTDLRLIAAPITEGTKPAGAKAYADVLQWPPEEPSPELGRRWHHVLTRDEAVARLWAGDVTGLHDDSRSGRDFAMAGAMRRHGLSADEAAALLWTWYHGRAHEMDERYFRRAWGRNGSVAAAEEFEPVDIDENETQRPPAPKRPRFEAVPFMPADPAAIAPRRWVYGRHLIRKYVSATLASGGTGKSSLLVADALALVSGCPLIGTPVHDGPQRVWLFNLEDPLDEMHRRVAAAMQRFGLTTEDIGDRLHLTSGRDTPICIARQGRDGVSVDHSAIGEFVAAMGARRIDVAMIDPFVSSHGVSENDNGAIDAVVKAWARIADQANAAIDLSHHMRKLGGMEATADSGRGASALVDGARCVRVLQRMTAEDGARFGLPEDERRRHVRVSSGKENLALSPTAAEWMRLESVQLANGDNVGVATRWTPSEGTGDLTDTDIRTVQAAVAGQGFAASPQARDWVGAAMAEALGLNAADPAVLSRMKLLQRDLTKRGFFVERQGMNQHRRPRPVVDVGISIEGNDE